MSGMEPTNGAYMEEAKKRIINGVVGLDLEDDRHMYNDPAIEGLKFPSVTTVQGATRSIDHILTPWAAKSSAVFSVDNLGRLVEMVIDQGADAAVKWITGESKRIRDIKREIGTHQHNILEALLLDAPIPDCPEHLVGVEIDGEKVDQDVISHGLLNFLSDFNPVIEMAEATVCNPKHGWAGTLDLAGYFKDIRIPGAAKKGARLVVDLKTGKHLSEDAPGQIVTYKNGQEIWLSGPDLGQKEPMPFSNMCGIVHLRTHYKGGYKLYLVDPQDENALYAEFLTALAKWKAAENNKTIEMKAFYPPLGDGSQPLPMIEDITAHKFGQFRNKFIAAKVEFLNDLLLLSADEIESIKGIGPKAVEAARAVLADYDLELAGEETSATA